MACRASLQLVLALTGVAMAQQAAFAGESPASGVWLVEKAKPSDDLTAPGTVWILSNSGIAFVREGKLVRQTACTTHGLAQGDTAYDCAGTNFVVSKPIKGAATVHGGQMEVTLRQASPADSARYRKLVSSDNAAAKGVCEHARRCCADAMPLLGGSCDKDALPREETVADCETAIANYRSLLEAMKKQAPASCAAR